MKFYIERSIYVKNFDKIISTSVLTLALRVMYDRLHALKINVDYWSIDANVQLIVWV